MSETDDIDAILRHLRRELGEVDATPAGPPPAVNVDGDAPGLETCLREIRSVCGTRRDVHRFLGDLFAPVLIGIAVVAWILLSG